MQLAWKDQNFLQFFVLFFYFLCGEVSKWISKKPKRLSFHFSLGFVVFMFAWFLLPPGTKGAGWLLFMQNRFDFDKNTWICAAVCAQSSVCSRKELRQAQARADLKFPVRFPGPDISPAPQGLAKGGVRSGPKRLNCSGQSLFMSFPLGFLLSPPESPRGQSQDVPACWSSSSWETGKESDLAAAASQLWNREEKVLEPQ